MFQRLFNNRTLRDVCFSLCHRRNLFCLWWWGKRWRAVWSFESRLFRRRLFHAGLLSSGCRRRMGPSVWNRRRCDRGWRGMWLERWRRFWFGELNRDLLVWLVRLARGESSPCCKKDSGGGGMTALSARVQEVMHFWKRKSQTLNNWIISVVYTVNKRQI